MEFFILAIFAFGAGFIDSVAGGGGLLQLPGLMLVFPKVEFPFLSGTNKIASLCGTSYAVSRYRKELKLDKRVLIVAVPCALLASWTGAKTVSLLNPSFVKPIVVLSLIIVAIYTAFKPNLGEIKGHERSERYVSVTSALISIVIGFYDGFIGPGTGSFLIFAFILLLGLDFLHASATAKVINLATNIAAAGFFISTGKILPWHAGLMACANVGGSIVGTHLALVKGNEWIKKVFLVSISLLLGRLIWDVSQNH